MNAYDFVYIHKIFDTYNSFERMLEHKKIYKLSFI